MTRGLERWHESGLTHFLTFSCYQRRPYLQDKQCCDAVLAALEAARQRFGMRVYGYVVMPEHVHLLVSEPERGTLADVMHLLKLSSAKRLRFMRIEHGENGSLWQKRYYDRNLRSYDDFVEKLRYIHRNPVKRGLVAKPEDWNWSSFAHYATGAHGVVEVESEWTAVERAAAIREDPG